MARCAAAGLLVLALARPARSATLLRGLAPLMDYKPGDVLFGEYNLTSFLGVQLSRHHNFSEQELSSLLAVAKHPPEPPASALQLAELVMPHPAQFGVPQFDQFGPPRGVPQPQVSNGMWQHFSNAASHVGNAASHVGNAASHVGNAVVRVGNAAVRVGNSGGEKAGSLVKNDNLVLGQYKPLYVPPTPTGYTLKGSGEEGFLGSGNFGDVWRAKKTANGRPVVLKFMVDPGTRRHSLGREASPEAKKEYHNDCAVPSMIMEAVQRNAQLQPYAKHFAMCYGSTAGDDPASQDQPVYIALEDAGEGCKNLDSWVPKKVQEIDMSTAKGQAKQLLEALALVHHIGVVHQDTKPENIIIKSDGTLWLVDFGRANRLDKPEDQTFFGDGRWMGPEAQQQPSTTSTGVDMWSAGLTLLFMYTGYNFHELGQGFSPYNLANGGYKTALDVMCPTREGVEMCPRTNAQNSETLRVVSTGVFVLDPSQRRPAAGLLGDIWKDFSAPQPNRASKSAGGQRMQRANSAPMPGQGQWAPPMPMGQQFAGGQQQMQPANSAPMPGQEQWAPPMPMGQQFAGGQQQMQRAHSAPMPGQQQWRGTMPMGQQVAGAMQWLGFRGNLLQQQQREEEEEDIAPNWMRGGLLQQQQREEEEEEAPLRLRRRPRILRAPILAGGLPR